MAHVQESMESFVSCWVTRNSVRALFNCSVPSKFHNSVQQDVAVSTLPTLHRTHGLIRCQHRMCEKRVINERRRIAIAPFRVLGCRRSVFYDGYLETLFQQLSQMGFDTHVGQHSAEDDPADPPFA